jgi:hypothetical protein
MFEKPFGIRILRATDEAAGGDPQPATQEGTEGQADPALSAKNDKREFTQEQLDKMFAERADQGRKSAEKALLEMLGVKSADEAKKALEAHHKAEAEKLSEVDKLQKALEATNAERDQAAKELVGLKLQRSFEQIARTLKIQFASEKAADTAFSMVNAEAAKDEKGMEAELKRIIEEHAYLVKQAEPVEIDADSKGKGQRGQLTEERKHKLKATYRI